MKNKITVLIACLLSFVFTASAFAESMSFEKEVFDNGTTKAYAAEKVIFRVGNSEYVADNSREIICQANVKVTPYVNNGKMYVPLVSALTSLGYTAEETSNGILVNGKEYTEGTALSSGTDDAVERRYSKAFASVEAVADFAGTELYTDGDIACFGKNAANITGNDISEIKESLEYKWDHLYMGPLGYVNGVIFHPKNPDLKYACTDVGYIYKWDNEYQRWMPLMERMPYEYTETISAVWAMALDPNDENVIYVLTGYASKEISTFLFKSCDGGNTWEKLDFSTSGFSNDSHKRLVNQCLQVDPNNSNIVYLGTIRDGLFVSEDAGRTWSHIEAIPNGLTKFSGIVTIAIDGNSEVVDGRSSTVYVGMDGVGVYRTTDGGKNYSLLEGGPDVPYKMKFAAGKLYVSGDRMTAGSSYNSGLFRLDGDTWVDISPTQRSGYKSVGGFFVDEENPNVIIAYGTPYRDYNAYRSLDGGKTWIEIETSIDACDVVQDPKNPNGFYLPHGAGISYVRNLYDEEYELEEADTWIEELCTNEVISIPDNGADGSKVMTLVYDHALMINERHDVRAWEAMPKMQTGSGADFCEEDPNIILETALLTFPNDDASPAGMNLSTDGGKTFTRLDWPTGGQLCDAAVGATKQENGWPIMMVASRRDRQGLYRSKDGGQTWEKMEDVKVTLSSSWHAAWEFLVADRVDGQTFYYNEWGTVWVTRDGGDTWNETSKLTSDGSGRKPKAVPGMAGVLFHTTSQGDFHVSYDYGNTWSVIETVDQCELYGFGKGKDGSEYPAVYMYGSVGGKEGMYISDDFCKTWRKISDNSRGFSYQRISLEGDRNVYGRVYLGTSGIGVIYGQAVDVDDHAPIVTLANNSSSNEKNADYAVCTESYTIRGTVDEWAKIIIDGNEFYPNGDMEFEYETKLKPGMNSFNIYAVDEAGNKCAVQTLNVRRDDSYLWVDVDTKDETVNYTDYTVTGRVSGEATVYVNGNAVGVDENNAFSYNMKLKSDKTDISVYAVSKTGVTSNIETAVINLDQTAPIIEMEEIPSETDHGMYLVKGKISEPGEVRVNGQNITVKQDNTFSAAVTLENGKNTIRVQARDKAGNATAPHRYSISKTKSIDTTQFKSKRIHDGFVFDGNVDDWELDKTMEKVTIGIANNWAEFGTAWDEDYLYVAVKVMDEAIGGTSQYDHENDCIEIYIDGDNDRQGKYNAHDKQLKFSVAGETPLNDMYLWQKTEDGFTMEIRIPWTEFDVTAFTGKKFGFEIDNCDNDRLGTSRDGVISFNGTANSYCDTTVFAEVTLVD